MRKCANFSPYMRRPLIIYDFATAFFFISVHNAYQVDKRPGFLPTHQAWWGLDRLLRIQDIPSTNNGAICFTQGCSQQLQHLHTSCNMVAACSYKMFAAATRCSQLRHVRSSTNMFAAAPTCSQQHQYNRSSTNMFTATATGSQQLNMLTTIALC